MWSSIAKRMWLCWPEISSALPPWHKENTSQNAMIRGLMLLKPANQTKLIIWPLKEYGGPQPCSLDHRLLFKMTSSRGQIKGTARNTIKYCDKHVSWQLVFCFTHIIRSSSNNVQWSHVFGWIFFSSGWSTSKSLFDIWDDSVFV